jgi:hypothetical protein
MWLFKGPYGQYGPAICAIALGVAAVGVVFIIVSARLLRRHDMRTGRAADVVLAVTIAAAFARLRYSGSPCLSPMV